MGEDLFEGLPAPSAVSLAAAQPSGDRDPSISTDENRRSSTPPPPTPALKSAIKREKPPATESQHASTPPPPAMALKSALKREKPPADQPTEASSQKRLRFKTTVDATETQIIEAMQKIASHIKNASKFSKASKLALQLIQAGSVKAETSDHFFAILNAAMSLPSTCNDASLRADYHALFSAAQDVSEFLTRYQKNQLTTWAVRAVIANDLFTDDSFVFSKAAGKIKELIASLPPATVGEDSEEAAALAKADNSEAELLTVADEQSKETSDPFGLDDLLPSNCKRDSKAKAKDVAILNIRAEEEESKRFLKGQREALLSCLEIAARRYRVPWCQTVIDILVKHAYDHVDRFTAKQREAIEKLWASVRDQEIRRKQGRSVTGKLDMNAFEWLQEKYAGEKISIRHAVGGGGERRAQQWLG